MYIVCMKTFKRTNWTTEQVIELIKGQKIIRGDGAECDHCKQHNAVIDDVVDYFYDFIRPLTEHGALGMRNEDKEICHIGGIPEEHVDQWTKQHINNE